MCFLLAAVLQPYVANLEIKNTGSTDFQLTWSENGYSKSLDIPAEQILTQTIIIQAATKPDPVIFKAFDTEGNSIQINGKAYFSVYPTIDGLKSILQLDQIR